MEVQRDSMEFDVLIIGAGPAGLAAAIRLAQLNQSQEQALNICVIEKGASVGAHILSGAVLQPSSLNELLPDWQQHNPPMHTAVTQDAFYYLSGKKSLRLPTLKSLKNQGNYIISLGQFCEWLAQQAEALGVNIFPGFAGSQLLFNDDNHVIGVQTGDMGLDSQGDPSPRFQAGMNLYAKQTLFAEGCRGSLSQELMQHYQLRQACDSQTYGIGIKELWKIKPEHHQAGKVIHTVGWPLDQHTYGGSFVYHFGDNLLSIGLVIGLDYKNPYLDPFKELQRLKTHPLLKSILDGGECLSYGARALNEGGLQSIPKLTFPGGMLIGCSAGFVNVAKIKGIHNAIKSGMLAAETIANANNLEGELSAYDSAVKHSSITRELHRVRNVRAGFHQGLWMGLGYAAIDQILLRGRAPWTWHYQPDHVSFKPAKDCHKIHYPAPDGKLTFDRLTQVYLSGTRHQENQPCHLQLKDTSIPVQWNLKIYDAPEQRYCPAGVYEIIKKEGRPQLQINAANCVHCKVCDIKDPKQNIKWVTPEGGEGPRYTNM